jgi:hypothetical protein
MQKKRRNGIALDLDKGGRDDLKGHDIQLVIIYIYNEVRAKP